MFRWDPVQENFCSKDRTDPFYLIMFKKDSEKENMCFQRTELTWCLVNMLRKDSERHVFNELNYSAMCWNHLVITLSRKTCLQRPELTCFLLACWARTLSMFRKGSGPESKFSMDWSLNWPPVCLVITLSAENMFSKDGITCMLNMFSDNSESWKNVFKGMNWTVVCWTC